MQVLRDDDGDGGDDDGDVWIETPSSTIVPAY